MALLFAVKKFSGAARTPVAFETMSAERDWAKELNAKAQRSKGAKRKIGKVRLCRAAARFPGVIENLSFVIFIF